MAVTHGENGSLVEPGKPELLEAEVIRLLGDEQLRDRYAKKGRETFRTRFTSEAMTARYENLYTECNLR
jgi:glycosyltransferase involved in cell wall biosynthesis